MEEQIENELVITVLADHNIEGQASVLWGVLGAAGWLQLIQVRFVRFADVGLPHNTTDRAVWRFAQEHNMILLTANRKMRSKDSLQRTLQEENHPTALPVITISRVERIIEPEYRERCAVRLLEIVSSVEHFRGVGRIFIP
jgi:predicted nuclease of predicted toxin-antitoxin system